MPISVEQLQRRADCEVPSLGTVRMEDVSISTVKTALEAAKAQSEADQPATFTNHVLAAMVQEPKLDAMAVAGLSEEQAAALVTCAVGLLGVHREFDALDAALPSRERLFHAHTQYYEALGERMLAAFQPDIPNMFGLLYENKAADSLKGMLGLNERVSELTKGMQLMSGLNFKLLQPELPSAFLGLGDQISAFHDIASSIRWLSAIPLTNLTADLVGLRLPEPFLSDALLATGLNSPLIHTPTYPLPTVVPMATTEEVEQRAEEARRERAVGAYDTLYVLETRLRKLVETKLTEMHGSAWWKRGVPHQVREDCLTRKQERETPDSLRHLPIHYTFIGELKDIILKGDNWRDAFAVIFNNERGTVETTFLWVEPVRKDIAHPREMSDEEYQQFVTAANWLLRAVNRAL